MSEVTTKGAKEKDDELTIAISVSVRRSKGLPVPYHEIVEETQASDEGDMARVGLAMNFAALYCTEDDCSQCVAKTGEPCSWIEEDLCSACVKQPLAESEGPRITRKNSARLLPSAATGKAVRS